MTAPREPTGDECNANAPIEIDDPQNVAFAAWYPQMGGYGSKCVIVFNKDTNPKEAWGGRPCFGAYIWHDGEFPFSADTDLERLGHVRSPAYLHHCCADQFTRFGQKVAALQDEVIKAALIQSAVAMTVPLDGTPEETKAAVLAATADMPGIVPGSVTVDVEDIDEEYPPVAGALDVDDTWRALRRPAANLAEFRAILNDASVTEDIAVASGGFAVTNDDGVPVAQFGDLDDARAFLSARGALEMWATAERRAELAESRVRGLEQTINDLHEYDQEHAGQDPDGSIDAHAEIDLAVEPESEDDRAIAVNAEATVTDHGDLYDDDGDVIVPTFYVTPREARCLAASLLRAACRAEEALARRARGEVTSEDPNATAPTTVDDPDAPR